MTAGWWMGAPVKHTSKHSVLSKGIDGGGDTMSTPANIPLATKARPVLMLLSRAKFVHSQSVSGDA